jgi:hypothetical protein
MTKSLKLTKNLPNDEKSLKLTENLEFFKKNPFQDPGMPGFTNRL